MGQLLILQNNDEICRTHYLYYHTYTDDGKKISSAKYGIVNIFYTNFIYICGIEDNILRQIIGKKFDLLLNDNKGTKKYVKCTLNNVSGNDYEFTYESIIEY